MIWLNPPYSKYIQTNVGKRFLDASDTCFGQNREMKKLFNRHNTKISYRCGPNLKNSINSHNKKVFGVFRKTVLKKSNFPKKNHRKNKVNNSDNCNCEAQECPLDGDCLDSNMVYEASVSVVGRENQSPK